MNEPPPGPPTSVLRCLDCHGNRLIDAPGGMFCLDCDDHVFVMLDLGLEPPRREPLFRGVRRWLRVVR